MADFKPGGDQKAIHRIVKQKYGGDLKALFAKHDWEWAGSKAMAKVATLIKNEYGSIRKFVDMHKAQTDINLNQIYGSLESNLRAKNVWLVGYEKGLKKTWEPEHWGTDGFSNREEFDEFFSKAENGALFVCYDANATDHNILGIYQYDIITPFEYHEYISPEALQSMSKKEQKSFKYVFKAVRCWTAPSQSNLNAKTLFPNAFKLSKDKEAAKIESADGLEKLLENQWISTSFYNNDPLKNNLSVWITSFWGWSPESWGCVGFTSEARPQTIIEKTSNPFLMAIYVTETAPGNSKLKGKVVGYYELSHEVGLKQDYISAEQLNRPHHPKEKWAHSFKALRAWEIDDDFKPSIREFYPDLVKNKRQQAVSTWAEPLLQEQIERLKALPRKEIQVFKGPKVSNGSSERFRGSGRVGGGNFRGSGYEVGEPQNTEKQLYILELSGKVNDFVEGANENQRVFKVGLSAWPPGRKMALNAALPNGKFSWAVRNMTEHENPMPYSSFKIAKVGEDAMKDYLAEKHRDPEDATRHLGGEFYLTDESSIDTAWKLGCDAANEAESKDNG